jgi:alpha-amylase
LIYSGQEEPVLRAIKFFDKDPMGFGKYERAAFYKTLLSLHKRNPALSPDGSFRKIHAGDDKAVYAYLREKAGKKVLVILNLSEKDQNITIKDKSLLVNTLNVFKNKNEVLTGKTWKMAPWGYAVYEY